MAIRSMTKGAYYYVRAIRPNSDGQPLQGFAKGFHWEHGLTGPHTDREARRIISIWSGEAMTAEEGARELERLRSGEPKPSFAGTSVEDQAAEIDEAILNEAETSDSLPEYEDIGYHAAVDAMRGAGFDFEMAGGGKKKDHIKKAWDIFRTLSTT